VGVNERELSALSLSKCAVFDSAEHFDKLSELDWGIENEGSYSRYQ